MSTDSNNQQVNTNLPIENEANCTTIEPTERRIDSLRILLVFLELPLPFGNAAARWYYVLLKGLVERGHRVTAFAATAKPEDIAKAKELFPSPSFDLRCYIAPQKSGLRNKVINLLKPYWNYFSDDLRKELLLEMAKGYDILHFESLWSAWACPLGIERSVVNVHFIVEIDRDQEKTPFGRQRLSRTLMLRAERLLLKRINRFIACTDRIEKFIHVVHPKSKIDVVPFGIEASFYRYLPDSERSAEPIVTLIGTMIWQPTYTAAIRLLTRLWPEIKKLVPEAKLRIIGWNARQNLSPYLDFPDLMIEENVPDIAPYFRQASVMLYAPSRGSGMKIKILESMAFGVPVVTTSEGVEGIPAIDGVHAGISDDDAGLIAKTVALLRDQSLQNYQRAEARKLFEQHCSPSTTLNMIESIYSSTLQSV